ncbi:phosphotransferase family protein [Granulicoccus phenolivorans]|uniref:phosphotransferase family protein n=1 Tax=Granulicoccus phenolivorans TaxID=266854 RepID=UPI0004134DAE|nr:phosphotransferase family protein [Granulicoccus phenolivorans]
MTREADFKTQDHLSHLQVELQTARWVIANCVDTLTGTIEPELTGLAAVRASRCEEVLSWLALRLDRLAESAGAYAEPADLTAELAEIDRIEQATAELRTPPAAGVAVPRAIIDVERIEAFLRDHPGGGATAHLDNVVQMAGGRSKTTLAISMSEAAEFPAEVVFRIDQESELNQTSVVSEAELLAQLHARGLKVPKPLHLERDTEQLGNSFLIMERLAGSTAGDVFVPPKSEPLALGLAAQVGKLHAIDVAEISSDFLVLQDHSQEQLRERLAQFRETIHTYCDDYPSVVQALDWLDAHVSGIDDKITLVHGDLGFHNVLAEGDELTAVLDWELTSLGHPARDLGYLRSTIEQMTTWEKFLEVYHANGGYHCDPATVDFYMLFSSIWLYQHLARNSIIRMREDRRHIEYTSSYAVLWQNMRYRIARQMQQVLQATKPLPVNTK